MNSSQWLARSLHSITPDKSQVITKIRGRNIEQRIKLVNQKGTFKSSEQCKQCLYVGKVQLGLGYTGIAESCDRDTDTWRKCTGTTVKKCIHFKAKPED